MKDEFNIDILAPLHSNQAKWLAKEIKLKDLTRTNYN